MYNYLIHKHVTEHHKCVIGRTTTSIRTSCQQCLQSVHVEAGGGENNG